MTFDPDRPDSVHARAIVEMHIAQLGEGLPPVQTIATRSQGGRYVDFLIPGLLAVNSMGASLVWFGYGLCEWRMLGLLRSLLATPLKPLDLLSGLLLSRWLLLIPETLALVVVAWLIFGFSLQGNWPAVAVAQFAGATTFASLGLLIGARGRGLESASGWLSVLMLTQWVFCGVFFSRAVFPPAWQPVLDWLPLSAYVDATRAVMLDRAAITAILPYLGCLAAWTLASGLLGLLRFRET